MGVIDMNPYTVILFRPAYMCSTDIPFGLDIYVAQVNGSEPDDAIDVAREEVYCADKKDNHPKRRNANQQDYIVMGVFLNHVEIKLFGWQTGVNKLS